MEDEKHMEYDVVEEVIKLREIVEGLKIYE